jgi:mRNA interferase MazF
VKKGDIVLIPFPFTDLTGNKNRPALVLISNELDITIAFISTQMKWVDNSDLLLDPSEENGLKKKSIVRLSKLATVDKELVLGILGNLNRDQIKKLNFGLIQIFDLN